MSDYDFKYLYDNKYNSALLKELSGPPRIIKDLHAGVFENATILPGKPDPKGRMPWGLGGVIDESGDFVKKSGIVRAFGGRYEYDPKDTVYLDETVIHINIIPNHWGHFLVDTVSQLWYLAENDQNYRITYCGWRIGEAGIAGNFLQFFEDLGIDKSRLIYVNKPIKVRKIILPGRAFVFDGRFNSVYAKTINKVISGVLQNNKKDRKYPGLIYLTRRGLKKSKWHDIGEKRIEEAFKKNGYAIISPEKLSFNDQVMLYQNAEVVASLSGTLSHNIVFTSDDTRMVILNRATDTNPPQAGFNNLFDRRITYIDVYNKIEEKTPVSLGTGPFWVECNGNLLSWFEAMGYPYHCDRNPWILRKIEKLINYIRWKFLRGVVIVHGFLK